MLQRSQTAILSQIADGVIAVDRDGRIAFVNEAARRIHGGVRIGVPIEDYSRAYDLRTVDGEPHPPDELPLAMALLEGQSVDYAEWRVRRADGSEVVVAGSANPLVDESGERFGAVLILRDITREHRLARELETERERLRDIIMRAPAFIAVLRGPSHVFEFANPPYLQLVSRREIVGRSVRDALPEIEEQGFIALLDHVFATGEPYVGTEMRVLLRSAPSASLREHFLTFVYLPLREADGSISGVLAYGNDMSESVRARHRIEELYRRADSANRAKSEFLAVMSHELRTPLTAVIGYADLLLAGVRGELKPEQAVQVERIQSSSWHLVRMIDEILVYTRTEAGREEIRLEPADIRPVAEAALAEIEPLAHAKGLRLHAELPDAPVIIETDPLKVRQILTNLLGNAVKFTARGDIRMRLVDQDGDIALEVSDTGAGIAEEHLETIFEPFWQVEQGTTRTIGGTGLGLTITRRLARLLGGDVTVSSRVGEGSTFSVSLPKRDPLSGGALAAAARSRGPAAYDLARIGDVLAGSAHSIVAAWAERLRRDEAVAQAAQLDDSDLVDHATTFLIDIAQGLRALAGTGGDPLDLIRDGTEIQRLIATLHGAQRARLGWTDHALRREYALLRDEVESVVRNADLGPDIDVADAIGVVGSLLDGAERISLAGLRQGSAQQAGS